MMRGWIWAAGALALVVGCDRANPAQVVARANGEVVVDATEGSTPTFEWTGGRARTLTVQSSGGEVFWRLEALDPAQGFASPARHGSTPAGSRTGVDARSLAPGVVHTVTVVTVTGGQGRLTFTPATVTTP